MAGPRVRIRPLTIVLGVLAVLFVIAGIVYATTKAADLPGFFPGQEDGSTRKHVKHALGMFTLAVASLVGAWLTTGPSGDTAE
jgi:hypothetical protein